MLVETNPYLLGLTAVVTLLHTVFDFLAFKNGKTETKAKLKFTKIFLFGKTKKV